MTTLTAVVEDRNVKEGQGSKGAWQMVGLKLNGEWYASFLNKTNREVLGTIQPGTTVEIEWEQSGKYKNIKSIKPVASAASPAAQQAQAGYDARQYVITAQTAAKIVAELLPNLIDREYIPISKTKSKRYDEFMESFALMTQQLTDMLYNQQPEQQEEEEINWDE